MFVYAMTLFPDKQAKAQQEMDAVVGPNRLPSFNDRDSLPYLEALFQEVLRYCHPSESHQLVPDVICSRWYPVLPLGQSPLYA
jgi:cytochrome P450